MAIESMKETRRQGESKRLDTLRALVREAGDPMALTVGRWAELVDRAVANATGLKRESSRKTFRSVCDMAIMCAEDFDDIMILADEVWNSPNPFHSKYHIVMKICGLIRGTRGALGKYYSFREVKDHLEKYGDLPS